MRGILIALDSQHAMGVAHRDLKPENILLSIDESSPESVPTVKIADFGLAKMGESSCDRDPILLLTSRCRDVTVVEGTALRSMVGTPQYLAPEIVCQTAQKPGYGKFDIARKEQGQR